MSTIILDIEGKNLYEWEESILTLAASQQSNTYFMMFLSKLVNKEEWREIVSSTATMIEGIDKVEENNSTQLLAAITKLKQEKLVENNVSTAIILKEILNNVHNIKT
jgi:hypothetical protein